MSGVQFNASDIEYRSYVANNELITSNSIFIFGDQGRQSLHAMHGCHGSEFENSLYVWSRMQSTFHLNIYHITQAVLAAHIFYSFAFLPQTVSFPF